MNADKINSNEEQYARELLEQRLAESKDPKLRESIKRQLVQLYGNQYRTVGAEENSKVQSSTNSKNLIEKVLRLRALYFWGIVVIIVVLENAVVLLEKYTGVFTKERAWNKFGN